MIMIEKKNYLKVKVNQVFFKVKKTTAKSSFLIILWINSIHKKNFKNPSKKMKFSKRIILISYTVFVFIKFLHVEKLLSVFHFV